MDAPASLGRLTTVPAREVWPYEALNFTPWLLANVDVLSDLLGMDLVLEVAEHPVGDFSLDLMGHDEATGQTVIVENQLEISDHTHLGQILTYAAGTDPTTIVWVTTGFRPEHRAALDWLNDRTDENTRFFGVEIHVVKIGDSEPAPAFRLIVQPNDWGKQVRAATAVSGETSERVRAYWAFWERFRDRLKAAHPNWTSSTQSTKNSWFAKSARVRGATYCSAFTERGLAVQLVFDSPDAGLNVARFQALHARRAELEAAFGAPLRWDLVDGRKSTRVEVVRDGYCDVRDESQWDAWLDWLIETEGRLRAALSAVGGVPSVQVD
ncbi:DUF4268 domain-containing protein [Nocardioides terrisoli]|uniref:DUF4268 domain-containing protein n=1 Tax=Nocardioides terrisoli TaxID=3388267 RepID=UPI00287B9011|nr:DUF4268 domain-containing protein [Nocardioides marmorisolisilvae]